LSIYAGLGFGSYITSSRVYQRADWTWDQNAKDVPSPWTQENLICLDETKAADGTTKYWGYDGAVETGTGAFWNGVLKKNRGNVKTDVRGLSDQYKFWNVPKICQKLFHVRGGGTAR
jgi:hypothetical protein